MPEKLRSAPRGWVNPGSLDSHAAGIFSAGPGYDTLNYTGPLPLSSRLSLTTQPMLPQFGLLQVAFILLLLLVHLPGVRADSSRRSRTSPTAGSGPGETPMMISDCDRDIVPISIATWNIQSGRNSRLETALRALKKMNVDLAFLTEAKLTAGIYTRFSSDYHVVATTAVSHRQGGVALVYRDSPHWQVESVSMHGPNVISLEVISGTRRIPLVGVYIPPNDSSTLVHIERALTSFGNRSDPIVLGDLNVAMDAPQDDRAIAIATMMSGFGLRDMHPHFRQGRLGGNTWNQFREGTMVGSRPDYILARDRRLFTKVKTVRPRHLASDHRMVRATLSSNPLRENLLYLNGRRKFPRRTPKWGPSTELDSLFQEIEDAAKPTAGRDRHRRSPKRTWISDRSWSLVDRRCDLRHSAAYTQARYRQLGRQLKASLKEDRKQRCAIAGAAALQAMHTGEAQEAWRIVRAWYRAATDRPSRPSRTDLQKVTDDRIELYTQEDPPEDPIPVLVAPYDVDDDVPTEDEIATAVKRLRNGKASGPSKIRAEQLKAWLEAAQREKNPDPTKWNRVVGLVQACFTKQALPSQMVWSTVVLIPKGGGGFRGIGLLELIWKVIESIANRRIASQVRYHDCLHGFVPRRGTGTGCIEAKLTQQLHRIAHRTLFSVFVDLRKAFDTVHRGRLLDTLAGYGVGPRIRGLLQYY